MSSALDSILLELPNQLIESYEKLKLLKLKNDKNYDDEIKKLNTKFVNDSIIHSETLNNLYLNNNDYLNPSIILNKNIELSYQKLPIKLPEYGIALKNAPSTSTISLSFLPSLLESCNSVFEDTTPFIPQLIETPISADSIFSSSTSRPLSNNDFIRGSVNNQPFKPGGLEVEDISNLSNTSYYVNEELIDDNDIDKLLWFLNPDSKFKGDLLTNFNPIGSHGLTSENNIRMEMKPEEMASLYESIVAADAEAEKENKIDSDEKENIHHHHIEDVNKSMDSFQDDSDFLELEKLLNTSFNPLNFASSLAHKKESNTWAINDNSDVSTFEAVIPTPAIKYNFEMDVFQKRAVMHLEKNECVFVAAHTSAGKTVVAEYAIALAMKRLTRVVYTSPIKTLSNQKFREFKKIFNDVGLITGDISVNPESSCLILTTEILRSMLYKGADLIRDLDWVIFDEVHYVNDVERGVVWEEVIIMLPAHVNIIMLSATVPNAMQFAEWVGRTKQRKIYVISTSKRPVPLNHHLWNAGKMSKIMDENNNFLKAGFKDLSRDNVKPEKEKNGPVNYKKTNSTSKQYAAPKDDPNHAIKQERNIWLPFVQDIQKRDLFPLVIFSFSRKKASAGAYSLANHDMTTAVEKSQIHLILESAFKKLRAEDRILPQLIKIRELLNVGVGLHHAGLLPIVKEVVEICFAKGLLRVLYATETFAMGVNMPTRSVCFNGLEKNDGNVFRALTPGEYTQMSGRAGRRGLDSQGIVIIICRNEIPKEDEVFQVIKGNPIPLMSKFRLTYTMLTNLLRSQELQVEQMISRSFGEIIPERLPQHQLIATQFQNKIFEAKSSISSGCLNCSTGENNDSLNEYQSLYSLYRHTNLQLLRHILQSKFAEKLWHIGRIFQADLFHFKIYGATSVIIHVDGGNNKTANDKIYSALILCPQGWQPPKHISNDPTIFIGTVMGFSYLICNICSKEIIKFASLKIKVNSSKAYVEKDTNYIQELLLQLHTLDTMSKKQKWTALSDLKGVDLVIGEGVAELETLEHSLKNHSLNKCVNIDTHLAAINKLWHLEQTNGQFLVSLDQQTNAALLVEFEQRLNVLFDLGYIDADRNVQLKGRVAAEVNTCEALILSEIIFENILDGLTPAESVALLSSLVFQQKNVEPQLELCSENLRNAVEDLNELVHKLGTIQNSHGISIKAQEWVEENIKLGMVHVVYEWAEGTSFSKICELTEVDEGTVVRCITRLDETCRDVRSCARVIGDPTLYDKMQIASELIKRDICFAASLYLSS